MSQISPSIYLWTTRPQFQTCISKCLLTSLFAYSIGITNLISPPDSPRYTLAFPISTGTTTTQLLTLNVLLDLSLSLSLQLNPAEQQALMHLSLKYISNPFTYVHLHWILQGPRSTTPHRDHCNSYLTGVCHTCLPSHNLRFIQLLENHIKM